jgi:nicotinamidase-related amidase
MQTRWYNSARFVPEDPWAGLDPGATAVVLVDMINWQAHPEGTSIAALRAAGADDQADYVLGRCESIVMPRLLSVLAAARHAGIAVVHARLASRSRDYTDVVPAFQPYMRGARAMEGAWETEPLEGLWQPGDLSVVKHGSGAFASDLNSVLRNRAVNTVLYAGVLTNACVMLSAAAGFDLGYRQYLLADCTAALTEDDQREAERFISVYLAQIVSAESAVDALRSVGSTANLVAASRRNT